MEHDQLVTESLKSENWSEGFESFITDENGSDFMNDDVCFPEDLPFAYIFIPTLYFMIFLIGFFGNFFVILLMVRKQGNKRLVDTFVLNLAVADLIFVSTLPFWALSEALGYWYFGEGLCKFSSFAIFVNRCSSILFLTGMSVERFLVVTKHWESRTIGTKKNISISSGCIWMASLLFGIPSLIFRKLISVENKVFCIDDQTSTTFNLVMFIVTFLLPLTVILFCYGSIFIKLQGHISLGKRRNNALKIIFAIIGAFICSWLPFNILKVFYIFTIARDISLSCQALKALRWGFTISACLAFTNSCANPIIYLFMDQQFQQQIRNNFPALCSMKATTQSSALTLSSTESSLLFASRKKLTPATSIQVGGTKRKKEGLEVSSCIAKPGPQLFKGSNFKMLL
uniref:G protein-coupled receptor 25 n=1 Tax=Salvator merianae TaxID=96440 RepID=A0A8D0DYU3_SALMN